MLRVTPHVVAAAYDFLRQCPPYRGWRLPEGDSVEFRLERDQTCYGSHKGTPTHNIIGVNDNFIGHTETLLRVVAHEMIHLHQYLAKLETPGTVHNAHFRRVARRACRTHGWDEKHFFI